LTVGVRVARVTLVISFDELETCDDLEVCDNPIPVASPVTLCLLCISGVLVTLIGMVVCSAEVAGIYILFLGVVDD
jgi:hypothetical protein